METKNLLKGKENEDRKSENSSVNEEMISDDDHKDMANEYELWKVRELKRLKRDE